MRKLVAIGTLAAMASFGVQAAESEGFSYNLIEGNYAFLDAEGDDVDGFGVAGSGQITSSLHAFGSLQNLEGDGGGDLDALSLGLGLNWPVNPNFDVYGRASFERLKSGGSESGWGVTGGVRGRVAGNLELGASLKYADVGDFEEVVTWTAGGRWYFTPNFAVGADYSSADFDAGGKLDGFTVSVRYDFGGRL